jgi:pimeloyl-ACP methyl ester carboxylesterase
MALVFVHGIKGGRLRDRSGLRWVGPRQALGLDRRRLCLPLSWDNGRQEHDGCTPDGPIESVLGVPVYRLFLRWAEARFTTVVPFSYDWRRELPEAAERLTETLKAAAIKDGGPPVVVAHSMGGLVTLLALRERPHLASGVLFAGVPFGTGIAFEDDCTHGTRAGLGTRMLDPVAHASWSAHWVFFPTDGSGIDGDHDWYDPAAWEARRLGVYAQDGIDLAPYRAHHTIGMTRALELRATLEDPGKLAGAGLRIAILRSRTQPVPVQVGGPDTREGDGRVRWPSAEPPGIEFRSFETKLAHAKLLDDAVQVQAALEYVRG